MARKSDQWQDVSLMTEDVTLALRPYGIDPADGEACAAVLRTIANALSTTAEPGQARQ
ncbi:MAG: hypothetical protein GY791_14740 [Alphaproteobacteria bacterium]|nr:hypothetical protein [Alphaproteobacteria bacterium]